MKRARCLLAGMIVAGLVAIAPAAEAGTKSSKQQTTSTKPAKLPTVHPGAFCSPPGKKGQTTKGTRMKCAKASDGRYRWIKA